MKMELYLLELERIGENEVRSEKITQAEEVIFRALRDGEISVKDFKIIKNKIQRNKKIDSD